VEPYDPDTYASTFFPVAQQLECKAAEAEEVGDTASVPSLYL
jgi:hypothetical protein